MDRRLFYSPVGLLFMLIMAFLLIVVVAFLFLDLARTAFTRIGFSWEHALLVLVASLVGSGINIPVANLKSTEPVAQDAYVSVFGVTYRIPVVEDTARYTVLAINFGGAIIPVLISLGLLYEFPASLSYAIACVVVVTIVMNRVARPIKGLGIVTPALLPPLIAALAALAMTYIFNSPEQYVFILAYVGGTLGTLIGADIMNLNKIRDLGAPVASIGGAGTFDGVFLSGLIAVLLV
ncbi:MAG: DUF1614 domain-containing protein [Methanotrichaceae archaeon]